MLERNSGPRGSVWVEFTLNSPIRRGRLQGGDLGIWGNGLIGENYAYLAWPFVAACVDAYYVTA